MLRMFFVVFAWPLAVLIVVSAWTWYRSAWPEEPADIVLQPARIREAKRTAANAVDRLHALPPVEQQRLVAQVRHALIGTSRWLDDLVASDYPIICLGEQHEPSTRRFLATEFFSRYPVDVLLLEATPVELARMERWLAEGRDYVPLLDADIGGVLRAVRQRNPGVAVRGMEETPAQMRARDGHDGSRERSLVRNFWHAWRSGRRHVILYGALHCADRRSWMYRRLLGQMPTRETRPTLNVRVIGTHQNESTQAFASFLESLGMGRDDFVIADTAMVPPALRRWFAVFDREMLADYSTLVVFHMQGG